MLDRMPLKRERARVGLVEDQQFEGRTQSRRRQIPRAVRDGAVADVEQPLQLALSRSPPGSKRLRQQLREELQALQSAADHHQTPTVILCHVIQGEARETRQ